jgi:tetratricopeptide (TPR) repeat protein
MSGMLLADLGKGEAAQGQYEMALHLRKKLVDEYPAIPTYQRELARTHYNLGNLLNDLGQRDVARAEYEKAGELHRKLVEQSSTIPGFVQELAAVHNNLGRLLVEIGQRDAARAEYDKACDITKKLAEKYPNLPEYQNELAKTYNNLGALLVDIGLRDEAQAKYDKARNIQNKLTVQYPNVAAYQIELAGSFCNMGDLIRKKGHPGESLEWFAKAITTLAPVQRAEPRNVVAKRVLRTSYFGRALAYDALKRHAEALQDWDRAVELGPPREQPYLRASRAIARLQAGLIAEAVTEVEELTKSSNWNALQWYNFSCVCSVAAGKIADKKPAYAGRAMELLHQAVKAGWKDAAHMAQDSDLDSLRDRDDFKKLIAELQASGKTQKKP